MGNSACLGPWNASCARRVSTSWFSSFPNTGGPAVSNRTLSASHHRADSAPYAIDPQVMWLGDWYHSIRNGENVKWFYTERLFLMRPRSSSAHIRGYTLSKIIVCLIQECYTQCVYSPLRRPFIEEKAMRTSRYIISTLLADSPRRLIRRFFSVPVYSL